MLFEDVGFVEFATAGMRLAGEFRCADCGYGAVVQHALPPCPMCGGTVWETRGPRLVD
jgi:rubrerythrin